MDTSILILLGFVAFVAVLLFVFFISRYRRCPSDKILVVYGKTKGEQSAKCYAGGAAFVWPVIQDYKYLDLTPMSLDVNLQDALSKQNIRVSVPSQYTVGISNKPELMQAAAERLLGLETPAISSLAHDIIMGQMRLVIANMDIEELNTDRDKFVDSVYSNVGDELHKIGLELINVNVTDIQDESGYIAALGKEAAAKAINDAKVKVANEERTGAIGQAEAAQDQRTQVADANSRAEIGEAKANQEQRIKIADANSLAEIGEATAQSSAVEGKNTEQIKIAESNALLAEKQAEADRRSTSARKVASAKALEESYKAEQAAENARKEMELSKKRASEIVEATIQKEKVQLEADASLYEETNNAKAAAAQILESAKAEAEGIRLKYEATAKGMEQMVTAAGGAKEAGMLQLVEKIDKLVEAQAEAIKGVEFGKITVFDGSGNGDMASKFVNSVGKALPQIGSILGNSGFGLGDLLPQASGTTDQEAIANAEVVKTDTTVKPAEDTSSAESEEEA